MTITTTWQVPQLSREWIGPLSVTADGIPVTDWVYKIMPFDQRPVTAESIDGEPTILDDMLGIMIGPGTGNELSPGRFLIWIRYLSGAEAPVLNNVGVLVIV